MKKPGGRGRACTQGTRPVLVILLPHSYQHTPAVQKLGSRWTQTLMPALQASCLQGLSEPVEKHPVLWG